MSGSGRRNLVAALGLHFLSVAAIILSRTLIDLIFLSTYPRDWLPYLFMGQTGVVLALAFGARPLVSSSSRVVSAAVLLTFAASLVGARLLLGAGLSGVPFGVCLWLAAVAAMLGVISWGVVGDVFDVREFKRVAKWINAAGTVGALVFGALVPLLVRLLQPESLIYVLSGAIVGSMGCLLALRPLPPSSTDTRAKQSKASPMRYSLFRRLALAAGLLTLVDTLGDYSLKSELARAFDKRGIGSFMGPFYAISSGLTLLVQFVATGPLLSHFGVSGLIGVLPIYAGLAAIALVIVPGLWPAVVLRMGQNVAGYSVNNIGREIAARPLPSAVRRAGKLYLKGVATPLGSGVGALLLFAGARFVGLRGVGAAIVVVAIVWFIVVTRVKPAYEAALEEAVGMGRLGAELDTADAATLAAGRVVAEKGLESADDDVVLFSLELLRELGSGALPDGVARLLAADVPEVRAAAAAACQSFGARATVPLLLERLRVEQDPDVLWRVLEVLARVGAEQAVDKVRDWTNSPQPEVRAGAVLVLLEAGDLDGLAAAATALGQMAASPDAAMRRGAAHAMGALRAGRVDAELSRLIGDADDEVAVAAIRAAERRHAVALIEPLVARLGHGAASHYAGRALVSLGAEAVEPLERRIARHTSTAAGAAAAGGTSPSATGHAASAGAAGALAPIATATAPLSDVAPVRAAVRALMQIAGPEADASAARLFDHRDVPTRTLVAREAAFRARRLSAARERLDAPARIAVAREAELVGSFAAAARSKQLVSGLLAELSARAELARQRLLYFAAITSAEVGRIVDLVPAFAPRADSARRAAALELLDALVDRPMRAALAALEDTRSAPPADEIAREVARAGDSFISEMLSSARAVRATLHAGETTMDIAQRVMLLRKVNLFSSLSGETLVTVAESCVTREFVRDEAIFEAGDPPDGLYVIAAGDVKIVKGDKTLARLAPGDFFGEIALVDDAPRLAAAVARDDGLLLFIDREVFRRLTEDLPQVLRAVIRTLIEYLKFADTQTGQTTMY